MKYKSISIYLVIFTTVLLLCVVSSNSLKQDETISDFINNFAGTPGSENFIEKSLAFKMNQPKKKLTKKKNKVKIFKRPKLDFKKLYIKGWLMISSFSFKNTRRFPALAHPSGNYIIKVDKKNFRINADYSKFDKKGAPSKKYFWFRLSGRHLYYSSNREQINILDNIIIKQIKSVFPYVGFSALSMCFQVIDNMKRKYNLCAKSLPERNKWVCFIQKTLNYPLDPICTGKSRGIAGSEEGTFIVKTITQPLLIIPEPSSHCNEKWNYIGQGSSWECECKEGKEQSPINLPPSEKAISSNIKPLFQYISFSPLSPTNFKDGLVKKGEAIKIRLIDYALRIYHPNMGKIVTIDGATYVAEEIVFHTPAEHKINGESFDMEMQVIHRGVTQGDIAKTVILSVLFKKKAGVYNKFLDKIDPFNLPSPVEPYREINEDLYIPHVFSNINEADLQIMKPFSFYTYQGSLTQPPCNERTILYIASKPIFLSSTTLEMFKEAIKMPDMIGDNGDVQVSNFVPTNFRTTQQLNGRAIFYYDVIKFCGPSVLDGNDGKNVRPKGHYEKKISKMTDYFFVNGENPSGLPGAFVVPTKEAKGRNYFI